MAYNFNGTDQYITADVAVVTQPPFTFAGWGYSASDSATQDVVSISFSSGDNDLFTLNFGGSISGDPIRMTAADGIVASAVTTTGYSLNIWEHAAGESSASNARSAYLNGSNKGTDTTNLTPPNLNRTSIGWRNRPAGGGLFNGRVAEVAIWNVALSEAEIVSLSKGFKPTRVRPQSLVFYAPLVRNLIDLSRNRRTLTNNNTATVAVHPRVI